MGALLRRDTTTARDDDTNDRDAGTPQSPPETLEQIVREMERHERALAERPRDPDTILSAAHFCVDIGKVQEASALFVQAMTVAPDRPEGFVGMSRLLRGQAMHAEAIDLLKDAIARKPESAPLWHATAQIMTDLDDVETALTFYAEALRLAPDFLEARLERTRYLLANGRAKEALLDCDAARAGHPDDSRAMVGWGDMKVALGQRAEARVAFTAALRLVCERALVDDRLARLAIMDFVTTLPRTSAAAATAPASGVATPPLAIAFFHADIPNETASPFEKPNYHAMLTASIAVARAKAPQAQIVVLSDDITKFAADLGADRIVRKPLDFARLMFERMRMERSFLAEAAPGTAIVFADSDVIVNRDPAELFDGSFDVALTWRDNPFDAPFNGGVALYRATAPALRFYDHLIATHRSLERFPAVRARFPDGMATWWGHQLAMAATVGWDEFARRESDRMIVDGAMLRFFHERTHNFAMTPTSAPNAAAHAHRFFLHFKGPRKAVFWDYARQLTPAASTVQPAVQSKEANDASSPRRAEPVCGFPTNIDPNEANDPRRYTYDLGVAPISFDVVWFLSFARNRGIKHIDIVPGPHFGFRDDGWYQKADVAEKHFRLWNIIVPCCQLAGMTVSMHPDRAKAVNTLYRPEPLYTEGLREDTFHASEHARRWVRKWLDARGLDRPAVVVLRESHWPSRNSNMAAWRRFAEETNAVVIPDTEGETAFGHVFDGVNLDRRMAMYEHAQVVMGTNGGPLGLCMMGRSIPWLQFKLVSDYPASTPEAYARRKFPVGSQLPWSTPNQRMVWADDTYEMIRDAYDVFVARNSR